MPRRRSGTQGAVRLRKKLQALPEAVQQEVKVEVQNVAQAVLLDMIAGAPLGPYPPEPLGLRDRSGNPRFAGQPRKKLVESLSARSRKRGLAAAVGVIGKRNTQNAILALWSEYGTKRFPKSGFMDRAFHLNLSFGRRRLREAVRQAFASVTQKAFSDG